MVELYHLKQEEITMVHTLELSREFSQETFEILAQTLKDIRYNKVAWFTRAYTEKGIPMICLRKFKPKRKDEDGNWVVLETEPYHYMIILSINTGIMFGGDGYLSNNVLTFTSDFTRAICDRILEEIPELEIHAEDRIKGYEIYWNTGKKPIILDNYYRDNSFKLRRIDYALDIATSPEQYIQLIKWGKGIRRKSFERLEFEDSNCVDIAELVGVDISVDDLIDDDEPDFDDMEDLFHEYSSDTKYIYYKSKSVNINIYLKGEQLQKDRLISNYNPLYDFLRIEIQVKKNKLNSLNRKHGVHGREFHQMPIPEYEAEVLSYYINQLTGTGHYVTHDRAKEIIDDYNCTSTKKAKLKKVLYLISRYQSVKTVLDKVKNGEITELGAFSTVQSYMREIQDMGINPVTISRNMKNSIPKSTACNPINGKQHSEVILPSLVDIMNSYNEQVTEELQQGNIFEHEELEQKNNI